MFPAIATTTTCSSLQHMTATMIITKLATAESIISQVGGLTHVSLPISTVNTTEDRINEFKSLFTGVPGTSCRTPYVTSDTRTKKLT